MKNYKNIAYTDLVNVNIGLNLHSYEENSNFILEFIKNMYLLLLFKSQNLRHLFMIISQLYSRFMDKMQNYYLIF